MLRATLLPTAAIVLVVALTACSSPAPAVTRTPKPAPTAAAPIRGAELQKITAWGECQQLVAKKLGLGDGVRKWSRQAEKPAGAAWVAVGHVATGELAYRYQCTVASDAKGNVSSEVLDWIYPA